MAWVWEQSKAPPTQRFVLLAIADCANDRGSDAYPAVSTLAAKTGLSERGVRKAIAELEKSGELQVSYKAGPKGCNRYRVVMRNPEQGSGNPEQGSTSENTGNVVHPEPHATSTRNVVPGTRHETTVDPARGAPKPSENHPPTEPSIEPSVPRKRGSATRDTHTPKPASGSTGTRVPDNFQPTPEMITWARENAPATSRADHDAFMDYWRSTPGARGRKLNWEMTWRNWMRRAQTDAERGRGRASPDGLVERNGLRVRPETAARLDGRARLEAMDKQRLAIEGKP
jgi:hypothetical protein